MCRGRGREPARRHAGERAQLARAIRNLELRRNRAAAQAAGYTPTIIDCLACGWTRPHLLGLFAAAGLTPHTALRTTKSWAEEIGLLEGAVSDEALLDAMIAHPALVNRTIVCTRKGVRLCRPS
jgi:arsenate reductase